MHKNDLNFKNPMVLLGYETEDILPDGGFGAVLASAGVGKTALLVQLSLYALLKQKNVLHISLDDPVNKVDLWYKEVFHNLARQNNIEQTASLWEAMLPHRFIMTFKVEGFSAPILEERLNDLTQQDIFSPRIAVIDGLPFDESTKKSLAELKALADRYSMQVWFTVRTHRHEETGLDGIPALVSPVADLFDVIIKIHPEENEIHVRALKGGMIDGHPPLILDPSTMIIKEKD
ncbi:MAG: AAA family ATPase [Deltaproteobacteria bacterium]|nr:AAA family ATPase [Deltaproteobacteria bacterium]MBW2192517.1 AAA family ATPase [Deltaproteobacteria bacterium]